MDYIFIINSCMLGIGLAMDAFSVSIADGLADPAMKKHRMIGIAGSFALFQFLMPLAGWFFVHAAAERFESFRKFIPWIALILLTYIGSGMIREGIKEKKKSREEGCDSKENTSDESNTEEGDSQKAPVNTDDEDAYKNRAGKLSFKDLILQSIATSIDALSVGFAIAEYQAIKAFACSSIIFVLTFIICMAGLLFGKLFGGKLAENATIAGGIVLIGIGLEIFIKSFI